MKTKLFFLLSAMLLLGLSGFSQDCPCVKTALIGNDPNAGISHNNIVESIDDAAIAAEGTVKLGTKSCTGKATWYAAGSDRELTNLLVKPLVTTDFVVKSILTGCPDAYDTLTVSVQGTISDWLEGLENLYVYPNPADKTLTLRSGEQPVRRVEIVDLNGKSVLHVDSESSADLNKINIESLPEGLYFMLIMLSDQSIVSRQIIKN